MGFVGVLMGQQRVGRDQVLSRWMLLAMWTLHVEAERQALRHSPQGYFQRPTQCMTLQGCGGFLSLC